MLWWKLARRSSDRPKQEPETVKAMTHTELGSTGWDWPRRSHDSGFAGALDIIGQNSTGDGEGEGLSPELPHETPVPVLWLSF